MTKYKSVEEYIENALLEFRPKLQELRKLVKKIAPDAKERISYSMPFYEYHGRLVYFALMKNYIGLYIPPPIIENHKKDLEDYITTKSAVHIPLEQQLPVTLITKLINARIKWNKSQS
ncbi:MAG TPA: DUF1801 domain-containing protein [Patescibacteria group bacterium]